MLCLLLFVRYSNAATRIDCSRIVVSSSLGVGRHNNKTIRIGIPPFGIRPSVR